MNLPALRSSNIRRALRAPAGHQIVVVDSEQIELRAQLWFSGQADKHALLANGEDLYKVNAAALFNKLVDDVTDMERKIGKATTLGCQYRMGATRFRAYMAGGPLGMDPVYFSQEEAQQIIWAFRADNGYTEQMWKTLDMFLPAMHDANCDVALGPIRFIHEAIVLPNDTYLDFTGLRPTEDGGWAYGVNGATKFLHGGILLENIIQALAKIVVIDQLVETDRTLPTRVVGATYDEIISICKDADADHVLERKVEIMSTTPKWAPGLVISAKGGYDPAYIN